MKKRLLTSTLLALTAMFILPSSAWAQTWNFAGDVNLTNDEYKDDATHWGTADSRWNYLTATDGDYLMVNANEAEATKGLKFTADAANGSGQGKIRIHNNILNLNGNGVILTIPNLKKGYTVQVVWKTGDGNHYEYYLEATSNLSDVNKFAAAGSGSTPTDNKDQTATGTVTADGDVALTANGGGVNIKSITIKDKNGTVMTKDQVIAATIFGAEEYITEETTWTFNGYSLTEVQSTKGKTVTKDQTDKLYNRSASSDRGFIIKKLDTPINLIFSDNTVVNVRQIANTPNTAKADLTDMKLKTAGTVGDNTTAFFAFNASVAGTCYAYVKNSTEGKCRVYFGKANSSYNANDGLTTANYESSSTDIAEIKLTSTGAGVFFIGGVTNYKERNIYAIRFVPSTVTTEELNSRVTLNLPVPTGGSVKVKAGAAGSETVTDLRTFASGTSIVLTPKASENYEFEKWTDGNGDEITSGVDGTTKALTMTLSSNQTVNAIFKSTLTYQVNITNPTNGTITVKNEETTISDKDEVPTNTTLTITASSNEGYEVDKIYVTPDGGTEVEVENNTYTVTDKAVTFRATFKDSKLWDFSEWTFEGDATSLDITTVKASKGLYYRSGAKTAEGKQGRSTTINKNTNSEKTWIFPDDVSYTRANKDGNIAKLAGNDKLNPADNMTPATKENETLTSDDDTNNRALAFTTTEKGNVYVAFSGKANKEYEIFFKATSGTTYDKVATTTLSADGDGILFYTASTGGSFFIGGDGDMTLFLVKFEPVATTYTLTANVVPENSGTVKRAIVYDTNKEYAATEFATEFPAATKLKLTAVPSSGYVFSKWDDNSTSAERTVTMSDAKTVTATFERANYSIVVDNSITNGTVKVADDKTGSPDGEIITLNITPAEGYLLSSVTVTDANNKKVAVLNDGTYHFIMPDANVTISAEFAQEIGNTEKTWNFADIAEASITKVTEVDGLYYRAGVEGRAISIKSLDSQKEATVGSVTLTSSNAIGIPKNNQLTAETMTTSDALGTVMTGSYNNRTVAYSSTVPGTLYVMANNNTGNIWFKGNGQSAYAEVTTTKTGEADPYVLQYEAPEGGTFIVGNTSSDMNVYAIKFVPATYKTLTATVSPEGAGKVKATIGDYETYINGSTRFKENATLTLTAEAEGANTFSGWDGTSTTGNKEITLSADQTVTANFAEVVKDNVYDFRSFAKSNLEAGASASIGKTDANVMTGSFTGVTNTMTLNDAVGIKYSDTYEIKLVKGDNDATTGIKMPRGAADQVGFYLYGLKAGDWFKLETGGIPLLFTRESKVYDINDPSQAKIAGSAEVKSGYIYVAKEDVSSLQFSFKTTGTSASDFTYIYSAQISNGEAVPAPLIGNYDQTTKKVTITPQVTYKGNTPTVYYAIDDNELTIDDAHKYTEPFEISTACTVKAIAVYGELQSTQAEKNVVLDVVSTPTIDVSGSTVTITSGTSEAGKTVTTYYTVNGAEPTSENGIEYKGAFTVDQTRIVRVITISEDGIASEIAKEKVVVDAATPSTVWDFLNDEKLATIKFGEKLGIEGYYYTTEDQHSGSFMNMVNDTIHAKMSWLIGSEGTSVVTNTAEKGLSDSKYRAFSINDLHEGDKIYVYYTATDGSKMAVSHHSTEANGDLVKVGGTAVNKGTSVEFESGAEIEVTSISNDFNYVILKPAKNTVYITKIEINPAFTLTNATEDNNIDRVEIKVGDADYATLSASQTITRGAEITLKAKYTAVEGKALIWQDGEGNEYPSNNDGTLTLTMDADKTVKALLNEGLTVTQIKDSENKEIARKVSNGLLEVTFNNNGRITEITDIKTGKKVINQDAENQMGYFNFNYRPSKTESVTDAGLVCNSSGSIKQVGKTGSDQVELIYPMADADPLSHQTWKIGYVMKKGVSGIYAYAILDGSSSYSELHEARFGWRVNPDIFNYAWVSDTQKGTMPTPAQMKNPTGTVQDATFKLSDGTIYTKYDWANYVKDDQLHGIMGDGIGAWLISPSTEWVNGGPTKQELTVHATDTTPIILQTLHSSHFGAGEAVLTSSEDKKLFGPALFYVNSGTSQDAMVADAKQMVKTEVAAWPYSWFTNNADIKSGVVSVASKRGTVSGKVNVDERFGTQKVQVVLTQGSEKPLKDNNGYQYYTETEVGKNFEMKNVRPGTYKLYVYALDGGATGTYTKDNVEIATGANDLGEIEWATDGVKKILWRIGDADHTTKGFKLSDEKRHYGVWESVPETLTYTVGTSKESDWYYAQVKNDGTWNVKFNLAEAADAPLRLTIATAGASQTPKLEVKMNDNLLSGITFTNDAGIYRSSVTGGRDSLIVLEVPTTYLQQGENTLSLKVWNLGTKIGGVMYDCIKLEDVSDVSGVTQNVTMTLTGDTKTTEKTYTVSNFTTGQTLYFMRPQDTEWKYTRYDARYETTPYTLTATTNGYLRYYVKLSDGTESKHNSILVNTIITRPNATLKTLGAEKSVYTLTFAQMNTVYYTVPGGTEKSVAEGNSLDIDITKSGQLVAYAKMGDLTSDTLKTNVYVKTPAIADNGKYDFGLLKDKIADYVIGTRPGDNVNIGGLTLKRPDDVVENTFDRFAFTAKFTEKASDGSDRVRDTDWRLLSAGRLRANRSAVADTMAILNLKKGEFVCIEYTGADIEYMSQSTAKLTDGTGTLLSQEAYEVLADGDMLLVVPGNTEKTCDIFKIEILNLQEAGKSTPVVYNIEDMVAKGDTLAFNKTGVSVYNMEKSGNTWELKSRSDFYPATNLDGKVSVRVGNSSLTYDKGEGTMQLKRAMAIHDLGVGDEIVIMYSGTGSLISVNSERSDEFTVNGRTLAPGDEIPSGAVIKITKTKYSNNYIVVSTSGDVYINAIYINSNAPTVVLRPTIELREVGTTTATYRITYEEGARLYYELAKDSTVVSGSTSGSYDFTLYESDRIKAWAKRSGVTSDTLSTVIYAPTPAPSESGDYDFFEQANELPADLEVTLDPSKSVTVGGQTLYKPTAMTAQTFNDKFAFTETNTTGKIKIRTNRTLAFNKGTNMNMALLNMKQGDIISFDYKGTIAFANTSVIRKETSGVAGARAMTRAETDEMESGAVYVVQQDGDVLLNLSLTEDAISIAKMYVASAPGKSKATAIDFATAAEEEEDLDQGGAAGVWCHEREAMIKFLRFTNQSDELPINNKVSTENGYGTNTTSGFTSGNRNIAIHNLAKGDTIKVRFAGGAMMYYGHKSYGNRVSVNGKLLQPGDTIHSGDVLKVEQVDYLNNYVVLRVGSKAAISGIFINTLETEKVLMPTITPKSSNTFLITSGVSTVGNEVGTIYTLNGTDPSMVNGTGGPYESFEIQVVHGEEMTIKAMSYSSSGMVSRITTLYYNGSDLTPIESVKVDENGLTEGETIMYDLQGRRVENPRPGNIYIINGKKVVYKRR